ncbi:MAG: DUF2855 family protein [Ilumatobacteraceae bacterium]
MQFDVDRTDYHHTRFTDTAPPDELPNGHVLLTLESFAFTANNVSYALGGDLLDYWGFFPAEAPWGRIPVMGIGRVTRSAHADIAVGGRYFGFFPMADHHVVAASPSVEGFVDRGEHRAKHAAAYRSFNLATNDPAYDPAHEGRYLILRGLFITSFLVDDFLGEHEMFGATSVLITSASSRTSIALAHRLRARGGAHVVGLTSHRHTGFVESVGLYDSVVCYDDIETLDDRIPSVVVDMSGNVEVIGRVHRHLGERLAYSCRVGATHWDAGGSTADLPGPTPTFFFAPSQIKKRSQEWGRDEFDARVGAALTSFLDHAGNWMVIERSSGPDAVERVYRSTLLGDNRPEVGHILSLSTDTALAVPAESFPVTDVHEGNENA